MSLLNRSSILEAADLLTEDVPVPEWGGTVRVKSMTGAERTAWGRLVAGADGQFDVVRYPASLVVACCVDEAGAPLFTADDLPALMAKNGGAVARVQVVAERLNGLGVAQKEAAKGN